MNSNSNGTETFMAKAMNTTPLDIRRILRETIHAIFQSFLETTYVLVRRVVSWFDKTEIVFWSGEIKEVSTEQLDVYGMHAILEWELYKEGVQKHGL